MEENDKNQIRLEANGSGRHRSPAFPMISFEDALTRLKVIYSKDKKASINVDTLIAHLGYKGSRAGIQGRIIAALKQYNLLDEKANQFKISENGFQILVLPESDVKRSLLIKESALAPAIFQRLLAHYENDLPSDENLTSHLLISENFNPESVYKFIKVFRANVSLVDSLSVDDEIESNSVDDNLPNSSTNEPDMSQQSAPPIATNSLTQIQGESLKFRISRESDVVVTFSGKVTQEGIDKLVILLDATKDTYPTNEELENQSSIFSNLFKK